MKLALRYVTAVTVQVDWPHRQKVVTKYQNNIISLVISVTIYYKY